MRGEFKTTTRRFRNAFAAVVATGMTALPMMTHAMDWYGGVSLGRTSSDVTVGDFFGAAASGSIDDEDTGWKVLAGMVLWERYVGAEFGYVDLGKIRATTTVSGSPVSTTSTAEGGTAAIVGLIPFGEQFGLTVRLGAIAFRSDMRGDSNDLEVFLGIGAQYDFSKSMGVRAEFERYNLGNIYTHLFSAGLIYRFGK